jgi:hypothetical protein
MLYGVIYFGEPYVYFYLASFEEFPFFLRFIGGYNDLIIETLFSAY